MSLPEAIGAVILIIFAYVLGEHRGIAQGSGMSDEICTECQKRCVNYVKENFVEKDELRKIVAKLSSNG